MFYHFQEASPLLSTLRPSEICGRAPACLVLLAAVEPSVETPALSSQLDELVGPSMCQVDVGVLEGSASRCSGATSAIGGGAEVLCWEAQETRMGSHSCSCSAPPCLELFFVSQTKYLLPCSLVSPWRRHYDLVRSRYPRPFHSIIAFIRHCIQFFGVIGNPFDAF